MVCCTNWSPRNWEKYSLKNLNIAYKLWLTVIFQIQILFSKNISLPTHSFPMLPRHSSIKRWRIFLSPWISAGSCLLWPIEYSKSNTTWVLRVGHKKTSAYVSSSCTIHCEGWELPCEESSYPDLAMLERLRRGTLANSPSSVQLSVIPDHGTSPVREAILNLLNQPLHQLVSQLGNSVMPWEAKELYSQVLAKLLISRIFEYLTWLLFHIGKFGVAVMQQ